MDDYLISQFIDNELTLDGKITFVQKLHGDEIFAGETISYLEQEKILQTEIEPWNPASVEAAAIPLPWRELLLSWWQPAAGFAAATVIAVIIAFGVPGRFYENSAEVREVPKQIRESRAVNHRFVLYREAAQVEIIGSFTKWQKVPLMPTGAGAYWEVTLPVMRGEHTYSFVVDGTEFLPDPTVSARASDDYGAVNSILRVEV